MSRRSVDAHIVAIAADNAMVVTTGQLARAGIARHHIRARIGGMLTPVARGTFAVGPLTPVVRMHAALAAFPAAALSRHTAAHALGLRVPLSHETEVLTPVGRRSRVRIDGVRVRSTRWLPDDDVTQVGGLRSTTVARTLCDLSAAMTRGRVRHLIEEALSAQLVTLGQFQACASAWRRRGRPGAATVGSLDIELFDDAPLGASELERRATRVFRTAGLTGWVAQYQPPWYDGVRGVVDLAWPDQRVVVELDGRRWHATAQAQAEDRRRDRLAIAQGWLTLRFGWQEIVHRPQTVVEECSALLASRSAAVPSSRSALRSGRS